MSSVDIMNKMYFDGVITKAEYEKRTGLDAPLTAIELKESLASKMAEEIQKEVDEKIIKEILHEYWIDEKLKDPDPAPDFNEMFDVYKSSLESDDSGDVTK